MHAGMTTLSSYQAASNEASRLHFCAAASNLLTAVGETISGMAHTARCIQVVPHWHADCQQGAGYPCNLRFSEVQVRLLIICMTVQHGPQFGWHQLLQH